MFSYPCSMITLKLFYLSIFASFTCTFWIWTCNGRTTFLGKYSLSSILLSLAQASCTCPKSMLRRTPGVGCGRYKLIRVSLFVMLMINFIAQVVGSSPNDLVLH